LLKVTAEWEREKNSCSEKRDGCFHFK